MKVFFIIISFLILNISVYAEEYVKACPNCDFVIVEKSVNTNNCKEYFKYFNDKALFNEKFNEYLKRDWIYLTDDNFEDFNSFLKNKKDIIVKPTVGSCGKGVEKIKVSEWKPIDLYKKLLEENQRLVEEVAVQCE